jgi:hypothetical protein
MREASDGSRLQRLPCRDWPCNTCGACVQVRLGLPATQWITVYNAHRPMKQRYHYNVANVRVEQHVVKGNDDGLYISSVACCQARCSSGHTHACRFMRDAPQ